MGTVRVFCECQVVTFGDFCELREGAPGVFCDSQVGALPEVGAFGGFGDPQMATLGFVSLMWAHLESL